MFFVVKRNFCLILMCLMGFLARLAALQKESSSCRRKEDCSDEREKVCLEGKCVSCLSDNDCHKGEYCYFDECVRSEKLEKSRTCLYDKNCYPGLCIRGSCKRPCDEDKDCDHEMASLHKCYKRKYCYRSCRGEPCLFTNYACDIITGQCNKEANNSVTAVHGYRLKSRTVSLSKCECGLMDSHNKPHIEKETPRIVGGHNAVEVKSWMAFFMKSDIDESEFCGGALINSLFVITAAHCVCSERHPCRTTDNGSVITDYDVKSRDFRVYVGIKERPEINYTSSSKAYNVEDIVIHHRFNESDQNTSFDIALLKLDRRAKQSPICLPDGKYFSEGSIGTVSGWGLQARSCLTDKNGPRKYKRCNDNWSFKGRRYEIHCEKDIEPPVYDVCTEFRSTMRKSKYSSGRVALIHHNSGPTDCPPSPSFYGKVYHGWCGACHNKTKPCVPQKNHDWGYCSPVCFKDSLPTVLQESTVTILKEKECSKIIKGTPISVDYRYELCAGNVNNLPDTPVFQRKTSGISDITYLQKKFLIKSKSVFGGKDSCNGDSGGPLWIIAKRSTDHIPRFVLIGIVLRGNECAEAKSPGIYARVKTFLNWIRTHSVDGACALKGR